MIKKKLKICIGCEKECVYFGYKRCKICYLKYKNYKINPVSDKEKKRKEKYMALRLIYLSEHPQCEICDTKDNLTIHHKSGRVGENLFKNFLCCCINCHRRIEMNPTWAYENEYSLSRIE